MTKEKLQILRMKLPNKYQSKIQEKIGYSQSYISQVLSGKRTNQDIIDCAIEVAEEWRNEQTEQAKKIDAL